jgi:hypothetical protein
MIQRRQSSGENDGHVEKRVDDAGAQADGARMGRDVNQRVDRAEDPRVAR